MIKDIELPLISPTKAKEIADNMIGYPTENRIVIAVSATPDGVKVGSLYLPNQNKEEIPRKGVAIKIGTITEDYRTYKDIEIGNILTYGMYAGKEIDPKFKKELDTTDLKFYVLSLSEIIYIEANFNA